MHILGANEQLNVVFKVEDLSGSKPYNLASKDAMEDYNILNYLLRRILSKVV